MYANMSVQNDRLRAEMEVNHILQKAIMVHHIFTVVVIIILGIVSAILGLWMAFYAIGTILPLFLFVILWIASKCNCQDMCLILVRFNSILSTLWFAAVSPAFVICCLFLLRYGMYGMYLDPVDIGTIAVAVITGFLTLSSAIFAVCGIWKSARNVVLSARSGECKPFDGHKIFPSTYKAPVMSTDLNDIQLPQATYGQPMYTVEWAITKSK